MFSLGGRRQCRLDERACEAFYQVKTAMRNYKNGERDRTHTGVSLMRDAHAQASAVATVSFLAQGSNLKFR